MLESVVGRWASFWASVIQQIGFSVFVPGVDQTGIGQRFVERLGLCRSPASAFNWVGMLWGAYGSGCGILLDAVRCHGCRPQVI
jgi:hypothetical protein